MCTDRDTKLKCHLSKHGHYNIKLVDDPGHAAKSLAKQIVKVLGKSSLLKTLPTRIKKWSLRLIKRAVKDAYERWLKK
jgi:hypothetical protein